MARWSRRAVLHSTGAVLAAGCVPRVGDAAPGTAACVFEGATPGAVLGPFPPTAFVPTLRGRDNPGAIAPVAETDFDLTVVGAHPGAPVGQIVLLRGTVLGPGCAPIVGADLQLWQADHAGQYNHRNEGDRVAPAALDPGFGYWGRAQTDAAGAFTLRTIVPGTYPAGRNWWRPPHLHWRITAPGRQTLVTQSFFDGDVLDGIAEIRDLNERDLIRNVRDGFEGGLRGSALADARRRLRAEMTAQLQVEAGVPTGSLVFRLA